MTDSFFAARYLILAILLGVAVAALTVRTRYALDEAADAHVRIAASETRIHELEQRLAEVEAFADFARPLWPGLTTTEATSLTQK